MNGNHALNLLIILTVLALIGYNLAGSLAAGSWLGATLAIISLGATVVFIYFLGKSQDDEESDREIA